MDQQPPSQSLNPYQAARDTPKPASIKVFGILNIVFGAMGFIGCLALFLVTIKEQSGDHGHKHNHVRLTGQPFAGKLGGLVRGYPASDLPSARPGGEHLSRSSLVAGVVKE